MNSFCTPRLLLLPAALLLASVCSSAFCQLSPPAQPTEGVLVLENGNILRGKVRQLGEHYEVVLPKGKLQVRAQQVELFCQDIEQAYQHRRAARGGTAADSHLELARWCLRHDLFDHAETELEAAATTDADHPRLARLERQLKHSRRQAARKKENQLAKARVVPEPAPLDPVALERAPRWARALFVRQIQPLVVHSCAAGGCHQANPDLLEKGDGFHLNRLAIDGAGHPEATLRNLAATLEQIDWQAAEQSALLQRGRVAHGSANASHPLPQHKLQVLTGWVEQLTEAHQKDLELKTLPLVAEETPELELKAPQQTALPPLGEVRTASYQPVDPFDPRAFNKRYAPVQQPTAAAKSQVELAVPHVLTPSLK